MLAILLILCIGIQIRLSNIRNLLERFLSGRSEIAPEQSRELQAETAEIPQPQPADTGQSGPLQQNTHPASQAGPNPEQEEGLPKPSPTSTRITSEARPPEQPDGKTQDGEFVEGHAHTPQKLSTTQEEKKKQAQSLELHIGIQWAIIIGSISLLVGLIFVVKSAFATFLSTPQGKLTVITLVGMVALLIGEFTRRRNYGFVAKGLTALGFAILYTSVFSAYGYFGLIAATPSLVLATCITITAMAYAICLDEVIMAFLALLGGFLSPLMLSIDQNRPHALFVYVTILSFGAMACSVFRKWRLVNILSFVGTFLLYTVWYTKYYTPLQIDIAISWLAIFFIIFLVVPVLYELIKKMETHKEAAILVLLNAQVVLTYLVAILYQEHRQYLAAATTIMAMAHFFMILGVTNRCPSDMNLSTVMLAIALFCLAIAVPLYFKMYTAVMVFAAKAVILTLIATKYRSKITQIFSFIVLGLAIIWLLRQLPLHMDNFKIILNTACLSWSAIAAAFYFFHLIHRQANSAKISIINHPNLPAVFYLCFLGTLILTAAMEWYYHLELNLNLTYGPAYLEYVLKAGLVILTPSIILSVARPFSPPGSLCKLTATVFASAGALLASVGLVQFHQSVFTVFANSDFAIVSIFTLGLFLAATMLRYQRNEMPHSVYFSNIHALIGIFLLWLLLTEEIYLYWNLLAQIANDPKHCLFLGQMYISIMWVIYATCIIIVGLWRKNRVLRYISLALYGIVLAKVFIFDMSTKMSSTYRIAGFVALGLALISVSYLYQFCKNKGLFQNTPSAELKQNQ